MLVSSKLKLAYVPVQRKEKNTYIYIYIFYFFSVPSHAKTPMLEFFFFCLAIINEFHQFFCITVLRRNRQFSYDRVLGCPLWILMSLSSLTLKGDSTLDRYRRPFAQGRRVGFTWMRKKAKSQFSFYSVLMRHPHRFLVRPWGTLS